MPRPKIFCQFTDRPHLEPISGDRINEINFYRALSTFADVYYNDELVDWEAEKIGNPSRLNEPSREYDLYYVRANLELFKKLPHPKITMAYPYHPDLFKSADAVLVTTDRWKELLDTYNENEHAQKQLSKWYPSRIEEPKRTINIKQTANPRFLEQTSEQELFKAKARMTMANAFGFFGRVTEETIPWDLMDAIDKMQASDECTMSPIAVFAGSIRTSLPAHSINLGSVKYQDMPALNKACRGILGQDCPDSDFLGSGKILDAISCQTPIICRVNNVRREQLGNEYPGFYETKEQGHDLLKRLHADDEFYLELKHRLSERVKHITPEHNGNRILSEFQNAGLL